MDILQLPETVKEPIGKYPYFPTRQQLYIWRNWEMIPTERLAKVLKTSIQNVEALASGMGLRVPAQVNQIYEKRGYITVIRNNWHVLPYEQLTETLNWTRDQLAYTLKEDDFLNVKLEAKPDVEPVYYQPLTEEEQKKTDKVRLRYKALVDSRESLQTAEDFDFIVKFGHTPRIVQGTAKRAVTVDKNWGILNLSETEKTRAYVATIRKEIQKGWGITLTGTQQYITVKIIPDADKKAESHQIKIDKDGISVIAVDEEGVLQGLYYLLSVAEQNGGFTFDEMELIRNTRYDIRYVHSYCALFGDVLLEGTEFSYPDNLLKEYARIGINGIWMHVVLYKLVEFPWEPSLSENWQKRLNGLSEFVRRAGKYGIKIYLYFNEPRAMPVHFFELHPELLGNKDNEVGSLCTSLPEVKRYISNGVTAICEAAPDLGGFFTITASENHTHCYSHIGKTNCPRCSKRKPYEVISEVSVLIARAAKKVNPRIAVIAWNWGWNHVEGRDAPCLVNLEELEKIAECFAKEDVRLMCTSEEDVRKTFGGVETAVIDYSISLIGPGAIAENSWKIAKKHGVKTMAKVQFNNTWECPSVPYLPVLPLISRHIKGLLKNPIDGLQMSWSLGGYPSMILEIIGRNFWEDGITPETQLKLLFGEASDKVIKASESFSDAMEEYPFHIVVAYKGPQYMGPSNPLFEHASGLRATMTGFPYDDIEEWRAIFPLDLFEEQFRKLSVKWQAGLDQLLKEVTEEELAANPRFAEFTDVSIATLCLFKSSYHQIAYNRIRNQYWEEKDAVKREACRLQILKLLDLEQKTAEQMYEVMLRNSTIGYEAANHYFFNKMSVAEKIICCGYLKERFGQNND